MDKVQDVMKNGKVREYLQVCYEKRNEGGDRRLGIDSPGNTRWDARNGQIQRQIDLRGDLIAACVTEEWIRYIRDDVKGIIMDTEHWKRLMDMKAEVLQFHIAIKTLQGMKL